MCIFHGDGRNGKSVFIETIRRLMGEYATVCPSATLVAKQHEGGIPNDIAGLRGARLVTMIETNQNVTLDEAVIKKLTGSDMIKARFLNKEFFEFMPTFKIIFSSNHKPNIRGTDHGIWRRIRMIPFDFKVEDHNDDKHLGVKLVEELPGILLWAIEGYKKYSREGLPTPSSIMDSTEEYKYEEDSIGQFIEDECVTGEDAYVTVKDFKGRIHEFNKFVSQKAIAEYMRRRGFLKKDNRIIIRGEQVRAFVGIKLKDRYGDMHYTSHESHSQASF
jgi:putative DNA primase/helicase